MCFLGRSSPVPRVREFLFLMSRDLPSHLVGNGLGLAVTDQLRRTFASASTDFGTSIAMPRQKCYLLGVCSPRLRRSSTRGADTVAAIRCRKHNRKWPHEKGGSTHSPLQAGGGQGRSDERRGSSGMTVTKSRFWSTEGTFRKYPRRGIRRGLRTQDQSGSRSCRSGCGHGHWRDCACRSDRQVGDGKIFVSNLVEVVRFARTKQVIELSEV